MFVDTEGRSVNPFELDDIGLVRLCDPYGNTYAPLPGAVERLSELRRLATWSSDLPRYLWPELDWVLLEWFADYGFRRRYDSTLFWRDPIGDSLSALIAEARRRAHRRQEEEAAYERERPARETAAAAHRAEEKRRRTRRRIDTAVVLMMIVLWLAGAGLLGVWLGIDVDGPYFDRWVILYAFGSAIAAVAWEKWNR